MEDLARGVWLYTRGEHSTYLTRRQFTLRAYGPGGAEQTHLFNDAESVEEFLRWYADALGRDGWVLQAYIERRAVSPSEPPAGGERRRTNP